MFLFFLETCFSLLATRYDSTVRLHQAAQAREARRAATSRRRIRACLLVGSLGRYRNPCVEVVFDYFQSNCRRNFPKSRPTFRPRFRGGTAGFFFRERKEKCQSRVSRCIGRWPGQQSPAIGLNSQGRGKMSLRRTSASQCMDKSHRRVRGKTVCRLIW